MPRKLVVVLASSLAASLTWADLGQLQVNSYLNQKLNAVIPLTNLKSGFDYTNLAIEIADAKRYKANGISYLPELRLLRFKVNNNGKAPVVEISSTKPIRAPVLNLLIHYKLASDDFYREYTLLLDPVSYTEPPSAVAADDHIVVVTNINRSARQPIAEGHSSPLVSVAKPKLESSAVFAPNYDNPMYSQRASTFNQQTNQLTTVSHDNLYIIARFTQLLYPNAGLSLNQIMVALGLANYRQLYIPSYSYESATLIKIPLPQDIVKLNPAAADEYLWNSQLSRRERQDLLTKLAAAFAPDLRIESPDLFLNEPPKIVKPVKTQTPPLPTVKPVTSAPLKSILSNYWLIGGVSLAVLIFLAVWRRISYHKLRAKLTRPPQSGVESTPLYFNQNLPEKSWPPSPGVALAGTVAPLQTSNINLTNKLKPSVGEVNEIDDDLIKTLEQILMFDDERRDVKIKLMELYLVRNDHDQALTIYQDLIKSIDVEDSLMTTLNDLVKRYNFKPPQIETSKRVLEFNHVEIPDDLMQDIQDFAPERVLDFSTTVASQAESVIIDADEDKLNLAKMYIQIEENAKAQQLLQELITASTSAPTIKAEAQQLLAESGL